MKGPTKTHSLVLGVLLAAIPLFAHHGGTSLYDISKQLTLNATVTDFVWTNPHVEIEMDAKDDAGKVTHWILEASSPPVMVSNGWSRRVPSRRKPSLSEAALWVRPSNTSLAPSRTPSSI